MKFDEINRLRDYFSKMRISEEDKEKRVSLGKVLYDTFSYILNLMYVDALINEDLDRDFYINATMGHLIDALEENGTPYDEGSLQKIVDSVIDTTIDHYSEEEYFSDERALSTAQDTTNTVQNNADFQEAKRQGKKHKVWYSMEDNATRRWHLEQDNVRKKIDDYFVVDGEMMRFPMDNENATAKNLAWCRCSCHYE